MSYSIKKEEIITYPPEQLGTFSLFMYEWIDNLNFTLSPSLCVTNADEYIRVASELFLKAGWDGDGVIELMWIPPFVNRALKLDDSYTGITVWHVKQIEDGISWVLSPLEIPLL